MKVVLLYHRQEYKNSIIKIISTIKKIKIILFKIFKRKHQQRAFLPSFLLSFLD